MLNWISWILFGALAGWVASMIMKTNRQQGFIMDVIVGIVGAVIGGFLAGLLGIDASGTWNLTAFFVAVVGAVLLLYIIRLVRR